MEIDPDADFAVKMESDIEVSAESDDTPFLIEITPTEDEDAILTPQSRGPDGRLQCPYCDKSYLKESTLSLHINKHVGLIPWSSKPCKICKKKFSDQASFDAHMSAHDLEMTKCSMCGMSFETAEALQDHLAAHGALESINLKNGGKIHPFQCEICEKVLKNKKSYKQHVREHFGERKHKCELCGKTFKRTNHLKDHMYYHSRDPKFKCDICGKVCPTKGRLQMHRATHMKVKPHQCPHCDRTFATPRQMIEHEAVHSHVRNYHCHVCNVHYKHRRSLRNHNAAHHPKKPRKMVQVIEKIIQPGVSQSDVNVAEMAAMAEEAGFSLIKEEPIESGEESIDMSSQQSKVLGLVSVDLHDEGAVKEDNNNAMPKLPYQPQLRKTQAAQNVDETSDKCHDIVIASDVQSGSQPSPSKIAPNDHEHSGEIPRLPRNKAGDLSSDCSQAQPRVTVFPGNSMDLTNSPQFTKIERKFNGVGDTDRKNKSDPDVDRKMSSSRRRKASNPRPIVQKANQGLPCIYCDERFDSREELHAHVTLHEQSCIVLQSN